MLLNAEDAKITQKTQKKQPNFEFLFCDFCESFASSAFKILRLKAPVTLSAT
jgi:hypothetical protein